MLRCDQLGQHKPTFKGDPSKDGDRVVQMYRRQKLGAATAQVCAYLS